MPSPALHAATVTWHGFVFFLTHGRGGECYRIDYTIAGSNSEICTIIKGDNYISRNYDYIYENDPVNCSIYVSLSDMNYTGKCVLSFHPQVPGIYTISDIEVIAVGLAGDTDAPIVSDPVPSVPEGETYEVVLDGTYTASVNEWGSDETITLDCTDVE